MAKLLAARIACSNAVNALQIYGGYGFALQYPIISILSDARIPVMTLLARTDPDTTDCRGLSMLLAEKTPGTGADPCPTPGMTGGKIAVQNYQDM